MKRTVLLYGIIGGAMIVVLKLTEYRFLVVEYSLEIYGGLVAFLFATLGIWLGLRLTRPAERVVVRRGRRPGAEPNQGSVVATTRPRVLITCGLSYDPAKETLV